jgi:hypothetical protein
MHVPPQIRLAVDTLWQLTMAKNLGYTMQTAVLRRLDTAVAIDSSPVLLLIRGLNLRRLHDRPRALEDFVWAGKNAKRRDALVSQIAYELAGLTLAESGYQLIDDDTTKGHRLLQRALVYYDMALGYDAGAFATSIYIRSLRERVRRTLGEDKEDVRRAGLGMFATIIFMLGVLVCLVNMVTAVAELARPHAPSDTTTDSRDPHCESR